MRCAACSGTGETTDGMCSSCLGTGLVGLSRPQNAINTDLAARLAKAERERDVAISAYRSERGVSVEYREIAARKSQEKIAEFRRAEAAEASLARMREALEEASAALEMRGVYEVPSGTQEPAKRNRT